MARYIGFPWRNYLHISGHYSSVNVACGASPSRLWTERTMHGMACKQQVASGDIDLLHVHGECAMQASGFLAANSMTQVGRDQRSMHAGAGCASAQCGVPHICHGQGSSGVGCTRPPSPGESSLMMTCKHDWRPSRPLCRTCMAFEAAH